MTSYKGHVNDETLDEFAEQLCDRPYVTKVRCTNRHSGEVEAYIELSSAHWGLHNDIEDLMSAMGVCIVDFSHVSEDGIEVYFALH